MQGKLFRLSIGSSRVMSMDTKFNDSVNRMVHSYIR